jgi:hypothetical protein
MPREHIYVEPGSVMVGDEVVYFDRHFNLVSGLVVEIGTVPWDSKPRYRVVDFRSEAKDEGAGRWIRQDELFHKVE